MSRTLTKVLVICAMIVVLPIMIVGTVFAAYISIDNIVNVAVVVDEPSPAEDVYITYNGNRKASFPISEGHTKEIVVTADKSDAYTFKGWYAGDKLAYESGDAQLVSKDNSLKINMEESKNYVAVYEVVRYTVAGLNEEDATQTQELIYGELLPGLSTEKGGYKQSYAWKVDGVETPYTTATFAQNHVTVTKVETSKTPVEYNATLTYEADDLESGVTVETVNFTVEDVEDFANWLELTPKHSSFWKVSGVKYKGTTYNPSTFADMAKAYVADVDASSVGNFELDITKNFSSINLETGISFVSGENADSWLSELPIYLGPNFEYGVEHKVGAFTTAGNFETLKLKNLLQIGEAAVYTKIASEAGTEKWAVDLKNISVKINGQVYTVTVGLNDSVNTLIEKCIEEYPSQFGQLALAKELVISEMEARFVPIERVV